MANLLFQKARELVIEAVEANNNNDADVKRKIEIAQNQLSSAFANSSMAEKEQLHELQNELDHIRS